MKEFNVIITETLQKELTIKANSREEAQTLVKQKWNDSIYILDSSDFVDVSFSCSEK